MRRRRRRRRRICVFAFQTPSHTLQPRTARTMSLIDKITSSFPPSALAACAAAFAAGYIAHKLTQPTPAAAAASTVRSTTASGSVVYESSRAVDEYLLFHYLPSKQLCPYDQAPAAALDFPKRCADLCAQHAPKAKGARALDVGCAVGRHTFEMAKVFDEVRWCGLLPTTQA